MIADQSLKLILSLGECCSQCIQIFLLRLALALQLLHLPLGGIQFMHQLIHTQIGTLLFFIMISHFGFEVCHSFLGFVKLGLESVWFFGGFRLRKNLR